MYDFANGYECVVRQNVKENKPKAIACNDKKFPGLTTMPITVTGVSVENGIVAFVAHDSASPTNYGLYAYNGKKVVKVIASGDTLNGATVAAESRWPAIAISPRAVSGGAIAFHAQVKPADSDFVYGDYLATPKG